MGYLSYFLEGRVFFHEHILYLSLTVVKDAPFFSVGIVIFSTTQKQFCGQVCVLDTGKSRQWRSCVMFAAERYIHYCKYLFMITKPFAFKSS